MTLRTCSHFLELPSDLLFSRGCWLLLKTSSGLWSFCTLLSSSIFVSWEAWQPIDTNWRYRLHYSLKFFWLWLRYQFFLQLLLISSWFLEVTFSLFSLEEECKFFFQVFFSRLHLSPKVCLLQLKQWQIYFPNLHLKLLHPFEPKVKFLLWITIFLLSIRFVLSFFPLSSQGIDLVEKYDRRGIKFSHFEQNSHQFLRLSFPFRS